MEFQWKPNELAGVSGNAETNLTQPRNYTLHSMLRNGIGCVFPCNMQTSIDKCLYENKLVDGMWSMVEQMSRFSYMKKTIAYHAPNQTMISDLFLKFN